MVLAWGLYEVLFQEVTHSGEWRGDFLVGWEEPGSCSVFFNVRIFTYRVTLHIYCTQAHSFLCDSNILVVSN